MNTEIPHLKIERLANGCIRLENESVTGDSYAVDIHLLHLRYIAEKLGLVRDMSASEADALRMVDKLARRIKLLAERINHLGEYLSLYSDSAHADLSYEQTYATATADLADEFVREIEESAAVVTPRTAGPRSTPENGGLEDAQKRGALSGKQAGAQLDLEAKR